MKLLNSLDDLPLLDTAYITIGNFDGLHIGHQKILDTLIREAGNEMKMAVSFKEAPRKFLKPETFSGYIVPPGLKTDLIASRGIDNLLLMDFNKTRDLSAEKFLDKFTSRISKLRLYFGYNFRFGKGNEGDPDFIRQYAERVCSLNRCDIQVSVVDRVMHGDEAVSSSRIRSLIQAGCMEQASALMGRPFFIYSHKEKGDGLGRKIGFPTLNLAVNEQILPAIGSYFTLIYLDGEFLPAMSYIGTRPTLQGKEMRIETHIIGYEGELEAKNYGILFISGIEKEKTFRNLEDLRKMLYTIRRLVSGMAERYRLDNANRDFFEALFRRNR